MIYAYVAPVRKHAGKITLGFLKAMEQLLGFQSFDDFVKNKGAVPGAAASSKPARKPDVVFAESSAKLVR